MKISKVYELKIFSLIQIYYHPSFYQPKHTLILVFQKKFVLLSTDINSIKSKGLDELYILSYPN